METQTNVQLPKADSLSQQELLKWGRNTLIFSAPALLVLLDSLQSHQSLNLAVGMAIQALIASGIDLLRKYSKGI